MIFLSALLLLLLQLLLSVTRLNGWKSNAIRTVHSTHEALTNLEDELTQGIHWKRTLVEVETCCSDHTSQIQAWIAKCPAFDKSALIRKGSSRSEIEDTIKNELLPADAAAANLDLDWLEADLAQLVQLMQPLASEAEPEASLVARLATVEQQRCPLWHEDNVDIRLVIPTFLLPLSILIFDRNHFDRLVSLWRNKQKAAY